MCNLDMATAHVWLEAEPRRLSDTGTWWPCPLGDSLAETWHLGCLPLHGLAQEVRCTAGRSHGGWQPVGWEGTWNGDGVGRQGRDGARGF